MPTASTTTATTTTTTTTTITTASVLPTTTTSSLPPLPTVPAASWSRFDELVAGRLTGRGDRAAAVAVSVDGRLVHAAAFGTRTPDDPLDFVTTADRFRIASISKVVTATVVLQLVDAGFLQLDEPVGQRLAGAVGVPAGNGVAAVTVRQLLSHTSGFPDYRGEFFGDRFGSCEAAAAFGLVHSLARPPGTTHDYSNLNYCLLGLLVADVTGKSYEVATNQLLLQPLGITGMRLVGTVDPNPDEVVHVSGAQRTYMQSLGGAGAWVATPADMVRILDSLDPATPGWHPLPAELSMLMRQALGGVDLPRTARAALRARHRRLAGRIVGAHRHRGEHAHDARAPSRWRDVVHPRQWRRPRVDRGVTRGVRRRLRRLRCRPRPGPYLTIAPAERLTPPDCG